MGGQTVIDEEGRRIMITKGIKELCAEAERDIETMTVEQVMAAKEFSPED